MDQKNRPPPMQDVKPAAGSKPDDNSFKTEIVDNVPVRQPNAPAETQDSPPAGNKPAAVSKQAAKKNKTAEQTNNKLQSGPSPETKHPIGPIVIVVLAAVVVAALIAVAYFAFSETRP